MSKISLLFYDNPISRSYVSELIKNNVKVENLIFIVKPEFKYFPYWYSSYLTYLRNNYYALDYYRNRKLIKLRKNILKELNFNNDFYENMYNFNNVKKISKNKIIYVIAKNINDNKIIKLINNIKSDYIIFSGGGILKKEILNTEPKFVHIHPGYLPFIRGADAILWSIKKYHEFASTSFILSENIDAGKIIYQEKFKFFNLNKTFVKDLNITGLYRFIYSFIDPLIRAKILIKTMDKLDINNNFLINDISKGNYYSFMKDNDKIDVFKKIFV